MAGYMIASYTVSGNEDEFAIYREAGLPILQKYGAKILVAEENAQAREGEPGQHTVVVEFASKEAANAFYDSEEYQRVLHYRTDNSSGWVVMCDELTLTG